MTTPFNNTLNKMFNKILIANRGEIACRVIRTAKAMGIHCVAVYSDADADALHVKLADEAYHLGPPPATESYLLAEKIIAIALESGAQAIHPGYGFLSENTDFARACEKAGITFIGPPASAIEAMGAKDTAKKIMQNASVPLVPGYHDDDQSEAALFTAAKDIGFPVLLKATAGGGGKGMRVIDSEADFTQAFKATKREALSSFADDKLLVEKYLTQPRHIEIQIFCDQHGNGVYLFERDCSIQRRHQKVIEEAPAPDFHPQLRKKMGETALKAASAINYVGAGTIEFLLDVDGSFYFMEMNTRLQVEHPVTEAITGQDLVEWQLIVASGGHLPLQQHELAIDGHAIEARIYAEDPDNDFLPATGQIHYLQTPADKGNTRIDSGILQGDSVSAFYDPMIAKLIVWGKDRGQAIQQLSNALKEYHIVGPQTNIAFLTRLAECPAFSEADLDTRFIERQQEQLSPKPLANTNTLLYCAVLYQLLKQEAISVESNDAHSPWATFTGWRLNECACDQFQLRIKHQEDIITVHAEYHDDHFILQINDEPAVSIKGTLEGHKLRASLEGNEQQLTVYQVANNLSLFHSNGCTELEIIHADTGDHDEEDNNHIRAPMNGCVIEVAVATGDQVKKGDALITIEAMKMEHTLYAPASGTINDVFFGVGDMVADDAELLDFEAAES